MAIKLLVAFCLVQGVIVNLTSAQYPKLDWRVESLLRNLSKPAELENCGQTICNPPCPGAYPPLRCPVDIPPCHFGCACYTDCRRGEVTCFQTKHCLQGGRFFTARRRAKLV
ncbi:hypothetical protein PYW07_016706 [Mythimna separata]|uniref:Uncharacterized protein n=1 Tax=Mythimna separata TaxID=271217 RepID=A0AAD8DT00_MYTSE|nr:hypothetical protein PYW07_016706 [Mythimna separata]